uniref:Uncharacterized protein n=1 Tax=Ananas comosus var. bracteatus TaxID=296719 RepID=A0A6V7NVT4_ANACO|nr:unnamed protein product [Ananas comosus var. bracteatus]
MPGRIFQDFGLARASGLGFLPRSDQAGGIYLCRISPVLIRARIRHSRSPLARIGPSWLNPSLPDPANADPGPDPAQRKIRGKIQQSRSPPARIWGRVERFRHRNQEREGEKYGLKDKVTGYVSVCVTRLARRVSHRLVILGCVCDWADENVRTLIITGLKHFGPVVGPSLVILGCVCDWADENVRTLIITGLKHFGPMVGPSELLLLVVWIVICGSYTNDDDNYGIDGPATDFNVSLHGRQRGAAAGDPGQLRPSTAGPSEGPSGLLLVPRPRRVLPPAHGRPRQHRLPHQHAPDLPFFVGVDPRVVALLDCASFAALFDASLVDKRDVLVGPYTPSLAFTGGTRVAVYLDTSESAHARVKSFCLDLLRRNARAWPSEFLRSLDAMLSAVESDMPSAGKPANFVLPLQKCIFSFLCRCMVGADPSADPTIAEFGFAMLDKWLALQLLPTQKVGVIPQPLEELLLHSFPFPFALVSGDYRKLYDFVEKHGGEVVRRAEAEYGLKKDEAINNILFVLGFNAFGDSPSSSLS